jgi:hypothetical protein
VTTNDVSPYLQRPVRTLAEVIAEVEQQRLETAAPAIVAVVPPKVGDASSAPEGSANKDRI